MIIIILIINIISVNTDCIESFIGFIINLFYFFNDSNVIFMCGIIPLKIYEDLNNHKNFRSDLHKIGEVYGIVNTSNPENIKQYIGSSKDLYHSARIKCALRAAVMNLILDCNEVLLNIE